MTTDDKTAVQAAIDAVREAIKQDKLDELDSKVEALNKVWEPIVKKLYPNQQATGQQMDAQQFEQMMKDPKFAQMFGQNGFAGNGAPKTEPGTVDADFKCS